MPEWGNTVARTVRSHLAHGYGDLNAPLQPGEYVVARLECPHRGCKWTLDVEWRSGGGDISRLRGSVEVDVRCMAHLKTHLDPTVRATDSPDTPNHSPG